MKDKLCPWCENCQNGNDGCYSEDPENCVRFLPLGETNLTEIKGIIETPPEIDLNKLTQYFSNWIECMGWNYCGGWKEYKESRLAGKTLGSVKSGGTATIGEREYIVLGHGEETTAIIANKPTKSMVFGKGGDYTKSDVRTYCNGEFYKELCKAVGKHNIIPHTVNLVSDDGSNKGATVKDNVSILTCDLYRRYREFLPAIGSACWTATRVTTLDKDYARRVCIVGSGGLLSWLGCDYSGGVRPFCILNSSVLVS